MKLISSVHFPARRGALEIGERMLAQAAGQLVGHRPRQEVAIAMDKVTTFHSVLLSELPQVGPKGLARILALNRDAGRNLAAFFQLGEEIYRDEYHLPAAAIACLTGHRLAYDQHCGRLAERFSAHGGFPLLLGAGGYPSIWEHYLKSPPPIIFALGDVGLLQMPSAAVLNSRFPSTEAIIATRAIVETAAADGFVVVSGAMKLGHRIAAASARAAQAPRVIVLDRGIFAALGDETERDIFGLTAGHLRLDRSRTLVLSPFRLDNHAAPANGARRDALIAAIADLVIAVEARPGGHMEQLCLDMLARGKTVVSWAGQNRTLLAAGARPLPPVDLPNGLAALLGEG